MTTKFPVDIAAEMSRQRYQWYYLRTLVTELDKAIPVANS